MEKSDMTAKEWKQKGDKEFNKGNWPEALNHYKKALQRALDKDREDNPEETQLYYNAEHAVYLKNQASTYFMMRDYNNVIERCYRALRICNNDPEALFHRCQALEALKRFEEAYRDAETMLLSDPDNKNIMLIAARLHEIVQEHRKENAIISPEISQLMDLAFNVNADKEKRETAINNLLVLARERAGAEEILKKDGDYKITQFVKVEKNEKLICSAIRIVGELCKCINRIESFVARDGLGWCLEMINSTSTERINASLYCLQNILNSFSGMYNKRYSIEYEYELSIPNEFSCRVHNSTINQILGCVLEDIRSRTITGFARDALIEFIMRNINYTALNLAKRLVELGGLQGLMEVASEMEEYKFESSMDITSSTQTLVGVCLAKIYENMYCAVDKTKFLDAINKFIEDKLLSSDIESKMRIVLAITTLILGSLDVVDILISKNKIAEMIRAMSKTNDVLQQKVVCECIIAAATKFKEIDTGKLVLWIGIKNILEDLYKSKDDSIRIRALVGLCKLGRFEYIPSDPFIDNGATKKLAEACRRFLTNHKKEKDTIKWAIKGLSYLTIDAEVKEELIKDQKAIQAMFELSKTGNQSILYAMITTLANLCNAYEYISDDDEEYSGSENEIEKLIPKIPEIPEMKELFYLCKFNSVQHSVPNEVNFVKERRRALAMAGVTRALVNLAKTDNQNYKELIARVFNGICCQEEVREIVAEQGGTKALLPLALDGTDNGKKYALQSLVHLAITSKHEVAFPGQMIMEVVRPIINLLNSSENSSSENCEILTALCRLAANDSMREHIYNEAGCQKFKNYMYEENHMLRRTSTQLIYNLTLCREVAIQCVERRCYPVNYLIHLCMDKDENTSTNAAGIVAMLTAASKKYCKVIIDLDSSLEELCSLFVNRNSNIQCRGIKIVLNMMRSTKAVATKLMETNIKDLLKVLTVDDTVQNQEIKELASLALEAAAKWDENQGNVEGNESSQSTDDNIE